MTAEHRRETPDIPLLESIQHVHVIGICGTAMGALAALLKERGFSVSGSDAGAYPPMSDWLDARGLAIQIGYSADNIPPHTDLVVVGNVARRDNPEVLESAKRALPALSLPEMLRCIVFPERNVLVVTGTHGKTTTSSLCAWMLEQANLSPGFFIGGVTGNFSSNYRLGTGKPFVIEGDEYDTAWFDKVPKFWHYPAQNAVINNIEFDHADIYPDLESILHVFRRFAESIPRSGTLWINGDCPNATAVSESAIATVRSFGMGASCQLRAEVLETLATGQLIRVYLDGSTVGDTHLPLIGEYNVRNFLGAMALTMSQGVTAEAAHGLVKGFRSVAKRQEIKGEVGGIRVIDDFAHHPSAVEATLKALRLAYPTSKLHVAFEAKSNTSRRAVFQNDYPRALSLADTVSLAPPWRKDNLPPEEKIDLHKVVSDLQAQGVATELLPNTSDIVARLVSVARPGDLIVGLSGSNFDGLHNKVLAALRERRE